jgi:FkbM family methyltransferase
VKRGSKKRRRGQRIALAIRRNPLLGGCSGTVSTATPRPLGALVEDIDTVWHTIDGAQDQGPRARLGRLLGVPLRRATGPVAAPAVDGVTQLSALPAHLIGDRQLLETVSRQHSRALYLGEGTVLCRVLGKYLVYADAQETGITPHLAMDGYWESWITLRIARAVQPGWHCLDVGANHGYYTLVMADAAGSTGRVAPVEPTPRLVELLRQTLDVNGFPYVEVVAKAATDTDGQTLQLVVPERRSMNARLADVVADTEEAVAVESITVDSITSDWPRVDLIKIDVEGAEEQVWRGMSSTIARNRDLVVVLEFNVDRYDEPRAFIGELEAAGFALRYLDIDAEVKPVSPDELLTRQVGQDWMLYLDRR